MHKLREVPRWLLTAQLLAVSALGEGVVLRRAAPGTGHKGVE